MSIETINKELGSMQNARESFGMEYHGRASKYYVRYGRKNVISGSYGSDIGTIVTFVTGLIFIIMIILIDSYIMICFFQLVHLYVR